jgi:hypothetical protein
LTVSGAGQFDLGAGKPPPRLLVVVGSDRPPRASASGRARLDGNSDVAQLIPAEIPSQQLNLSKQLAASRHLLKQHAPDLSRYDCVLNLVTDPDQNPRTLEVLGKLLRGYRGRVINRPEAVLRSTRDQVAKRLAGIDGLRVPGICRLRNPKPGAAAAAVARGGLDFPLIVRHAGTHTGKIVGVVGDAAQLDAACAAPGTYILIEYVDFRDDDGLCRKHRLWSFGGISIFRHLIISDDWNVHVSERTRFMLARDDLIAEEASLLERADGAFLPLVHAVFDAVRARLGLDFFGMDFALDRDGRVILFEANATMNFFPLEPHLKFSYLGRIHGPAQQAFTAMLGFAATNAADKS